MGRVRTEFGEISPMRLLRAATRRITNLPLTLEWNLGEHGIAARTANGALRNSRAGERCVLICNGPSLNSTDMSLLKTEATICTNRSYLLFDEWGFTPTYYTAVAQHVLEQFSEDISNLPMPKFVDFKYRKLFQDQSGFHFVRMPPRLMESFSPDITRPISSGGTVTYVCLQLAYYLGFRTVVIVGMDHRFKATGVPTSSEVRKDDVDEDHAHPNYFPKGVKWELPDLLRSENAYRLARHAFEADGRRIIDATVGGACNVFEKLPLDQALES